MTLLRLGRWLVVGGGALAALGMITGFITMLGDEQRYVLNLLGLVPVGVLSAFCGVILVVMTEPRGREPPAEPEPPHPPDSDRSEPSEPSEKP
jgi:hypothetical protein